MRICFYGHFTGGGTESACLKVANGLCKSYEIFILNSEKRDLTFYCDKSIRYSCLKSGNILIQNIEMFKFLKRNNIDILISLEALSGIVSFLPCIFLKTKYILWEHANYYQTQGSSKIQKIRQLELKYSDAYVVLTNRDKNNFKNHFKIKTKLVCIYNIADVAIKENYSIQSKYIISVGHIREIKNFKIIPDIGEIVFKKHPDWKWLIYGDGLGEEYDILKEKIKDFHLENNVILCGRSNNMNEIYKKSSMYVMTSLQEGLPMVLLEAKSNRLPLISFDIETGPDEIIKDKVNGFLIPPYDINKMASSICELIENDEKRINFSNNSSLDLELFDKDNVLKQWSKLIFEIKEK